MSDIEVHNGEPKVAPLRRGRPYKYDATPLMDAADQHEGQWVSQMVTWAAAQSYRRQIIRSGGYKLSICRTDEPDIRQVLVKKR